MNPPRGVETAPYSRTRALEAVAISSQFPLSPILLAYAYVYHGAMR